ncbi:unnamed protein product [Prunus armeniaca]|uniref:SRP54-type proteins GTP-binding domain-containing protein n=1 Tax=Prunus armeniaca TaxID=36596 RepID=A0A6J5U5V6_PRUAR|nr:unnamed protein product [Prunus armeniaca]
MAAGDTFRAAACDQLEIWAERTGCEIVVAEKEKAKAASGRELEWKRWMNLSRGRVEFGCVGERDRERERERQWWRVGLDPRGLKSEGEGWGLVGWVG